MKPGFRYLSVFLFLWGFIFPCQLLYAQKQPFSVNIKSKNDKEIVIHWNYINGQNNYDILRANGPVGNYVKIATKKATSSKEAFYRDEGLTPNTEYCYKVRVSNTSGSSPNICETTSSPNPPERYTITGKVSNNGQPVMGVTVKFDCDNHYYSGSNVTDNNGLYEIKGVLEGQAGDLIAEKDGCTITEKFRIVDIRENLVRNFENADCPVPDYIIVTKPDANDVWKTNKAYTIKYETNIKDPRVSIKLLDANLHFIRVINPAATPDGDYRWSVIPSSVATGQYYISIEGIHSKTKGRSSLFTIQNEVVPDDNSPPVFVSSDIDPPIGDPESYFTFSSKWEDADDDYIIAVKVRYRTKNEVWIEDELGFVNGTNPPEFSKQIRISNAGDYEVQFQASDSKTTEIDDLIHTTEWIDGGSFTVGDVNESCTFSDLKESHHAFEEIKFLCEEGIIHGDDKSGTVRPNDDINRAELAKIAFKSIKLDKAAYAENYPSPYNDLQEKKDSEWYYSFAKNLLYLEYDNGVSPFDRNRFNFYPSDTITRAHTLKVFLETWNIELETGSNPFNNDHSSHDAYQYLYTAYQYGLISKNPRPNESCKRSEAFEFLYNIMTHPEISEPLVREDDFYKPENLTPINFSQPNTLSFPYSKVSFNIPGPGLPLVFQHRYQSYSYDIPKELLKLSPLGTNWTHSYNCFLSVLRGDSEKSHEERVVITFPDGSFSSFEYCTGEYKCKTEGVFSTLTEVSTAQYNLVTQDKTTFTFVKIGGTRDEFPFVLTSISDRNGNILTISWENSYLGSKAKRISQVTGTAGRTLIFEYYPSSDLLKEVTDPINRKIKFSYDNTALGDDARLIEFTDAKSYKTIYHYPAEEKNKYLLNGITLPKENYIGATYKDRKLASLKTADDIINVVSKYNYDNLSASSLYSLDVWKGNKRLGTSTYDTYNNLKTYESLGNSSQLEYNDENHPTIPTKITLDETHVDYEHDDRGNIIRATIDGNDYVYGYNGEDQLISYTDAEKNTYEWDYDDVGNLIRYRTPLGETKYSLNSKGLPFSITNPEGIITYFEYDQWDNLKKSWLPEGIEMNATYDNIGRIRTLIKPDGSTVKYNYDNNDNVSEVTAFTKLVYGYDQNDNLKTITNIMDQVTELVYSEEEDYLEEFNYGGMNKTMTYDDSKGSLSTYTDPKNQLFTYTYNSNELLENVEAAGKNLHYTYTSKNKLQQVNYDGKSTLIGYDHLERIKSVTDIYGNTVTYTYNTNNQKKTITYPGSKTVEYIYKDNLLSKVKHWQGEISYTHRKDGLLKQIDYPNNISGKYTYDKAGRVIGLAWIKSENDTLFSSEYELNPMGFPLIENRKSVFDLDTITIDEVELTYSYNKSNNQIISAGDISFQHDANGNMNHKGEALYVWDEYNRLTETPDFTFIYDGFGNRLQKQNRSTNEITRYILDINSGMPWVLAEADENNQIRQNYIYGLGLTSRIDAGENVSYYHHDLKGNIVAISDKDGNITHKYEYSPYGKLITFEETDHNPFRFVGQFGVMYETDNLYFMRARYYDPEIGGFLNVDPVFDAENLYSYAGSNPIIFIDPNGATPFKPDLFWEAFVETVSDPNVWKDVVHNTLDLVGLVPAFGEAADGINGIIYLVEGDTEKAGYSFAAMMPIGGQGATVFKHSKTVVAKTGIKNVDDLIYAGTKLPKIKNATQLSVKGNADDIFNSLSKEGELIKPNRIKLPDGTIITKYHSSTNGVPTLLIDQGVKKYKIRIK